MYPEDFFLDDESNPVGPGALDMGLLERVRCGEDVGHSDIELAVSLTRLVHTEFERYGTDGSQRTHEGEIRLAVRILKVLIQRVGLEWFVPFSDFGTFRSHWMANNGYGSWQARRDILNDVFEATHVRLAELEDSEIGSTLARPVTPHAGTGWSRVDIEIGELRRHFQTARTEQDYRNIGNDCVAVLERLSEVVYEPELHLGEGEEEPPVANTKQRLGRFVEVAAEGRGNAEVRKVTRAVIELAQAVKHRSTPNRRDAGIAADSVIQLANILRRLAEPA